MRDKPYYLPGDRQSRGDISRLLRVDHAGEYGAVRIYQGQIAGAKDSANKPILRHMLEQEQNHLQHFNQLLNEHKVRPSFLSPLWHGGGWLLGYVTSRMGEVAAFACTEAVEDVIDAHYSEQIADLHDAKMGGEGKGEDGEGLVDLLERFRLEELEHRDTAIEHGARGAVGHGLLVRLIGKLSKLSIAIAKDI